MIFFYSATNSLTMYRTGVLIVLIALTSCVLGGPGKGKFSEAWAKCIEKSGMDRETFRETPWEDPKKKCFQACMMKDHGHLKEDGSVDTEKMIADIPPDFEDHDTISEAITECSANQKEDECETADLVMKCLHDKGALIHPGAGRMHGVIKKCLKENGIERKDLEELSPDDQKKKCFGACVLKDLGHLKDGTFDTEKALAELPPDVPDRDRIVEVIRECGTNKGDDDCETAGLIWKCLEEKDGLPPMPHRHHHHHHHGPE